MTADNSAAHSEEPAPDAQNTAPEQERQSAESAPAVTDADENRKASEGYTRRIDELTRNWRETERDRDHWRTLALQSRSETPGVQSHGERDEPGGEPELKTLADFNFDERAYGKYMLGEARKAARGELDGFRKESTESEQREAQARSRREFDGRIESFTKAEKITDFDVAFRDPRDGGPTITESMAQTIMASKNGPALLYFLGKNPQLSEDIARMPPGMQAFELGMLAATKLAAPATTRVSNAPPPAPTVNGASDAPVKKDPTKMSDSEWYAAQRRAANFKKG